jgi:hypothetical protein
MEARERGGAVPGEKGIGTYIVFPAAGILSGCACMVVLRIVYYFIVGYW